MKIIALSIVFLLVSSCRLPERRIEPVKINGFDSLWVASRRQITSAELLAIVKIVKTQKSINAEDASALLEIYSDNLDEFITASHHGKNDENIDNEDVERCLELILQHGNLIERAAEITQNSIYRQILGTVHNSFEGGYLSGAAAGAGDLIALYLTAYRRVVAKDDKQMWNDELKRQTRNGKISILRGYEQFCSDIVSGNRQAAKEQQEQARKFLEDLKIYNANLGDDKKILDGSQRLVQATNATQLQKNSMLNLMDVATDEESFKSPQEAKKAVSEIASLTEAAARSLTVSIRDGSPY